MTEDEVTGWHHQLNGQELEQTQGDSEGQGSLACLSLWGRKHDLATEQQQGHRRTSPKFLLRGPNFNFNP